MAARLSALLAGRLAEITYDPSKEVSAVCFLKYSRNERPEKYSVKLLIRSKPIIQVASIVKCKAFPFVVTEKHNLSCSTKSNCEHKVCVIPNICALTGLQSASYFHAAYNRFMSFHRPLSPHAMRT